MLIYLYIALLIALDQISKLWVVKVIKPIGSVKVIDGLLNFTYLENRGIAFGMLQNMYYLVIPISLVIVGICGYFMHTAMKNNLRYPEILMATVIAGAVGNIIDKLFRGYVVDFIEVSFFNFPVFNIADIFVTVSTILIAVYIFFSKDGDIFANKL